MINVNIFYFLIEKHPEVIFIFIITLLSKYIFSFFAIILIQIANICCKNQLLKFIEKSSLENKKNTYKDITSLKKFQYSLSLSIVLYAPLLYMEYLNYFIMKWYVIIPITIISFYIIDISLKIKNSKIVYYFQKKWYNKNK